MSWLGNLLWFLLGGLVCGLGWIVAGVLLCATIIGIPVGFQLFKYAGLVFFPFGKKIISDGKFSSIILNVLWVCFFGIELCVFHLIFAFLMAITIIGIPFAKQHLKLAQLAFVPFGSSVVKA